MTTKKTMKRDPIQEQRDAFIRENSEPRVGGAWEYAENCLADYLYREACRLFPYPWEVEESQKKVAGQTKKKVAGKKDVLCDSCLMEMSDDEIDEAAGDDECLCAACR